MPSPRPVLRRASTVLLVAGLAAAPVGVAAAATSYAPVQRTNIDRPVPAGATLLPNGRLVSPAGRTVDLGDFPEGLAISPDGVLAVATGVGQGEGVPHGDFGGLCVDGQERGPCAVAARFAGPTTVPDEALFVTNLVTGDYREIRVPEGQCDPTATADTHPEHCQELGLTFSPDGRHLYATGGGNDALMDFPVAADDTVGTPDVVYLQELNVAPGGTGAYQSPNPGTQAARTKGVAVTPDGATILVTKEQSGTLDLLNATDLSLKQRVAFGPVTNPTAANGSVAYPYAVVVAPDGKTAYVTLQGTGEVVTLALAGGTATQVLRLPAGDHPTGLAVSPDGSTLLVTGANDDTVRVFPLTNGLPGPSSSVTVHAKPDEVYGSTPNAVAFDGNDRAYVALAGDDAVAALDRGTGGFTVTGMLPTGWYPTSVAVRPGTREVLAVSAKGRGSRYVPHSDYVPAAPGGGPQAVTPGYYDGDDMPGLLTIAPAPTAAQLTAGQATAVRNLDFAGTGGGAHPGPIPTDPSSAGQSPITHVVYIVRENRTYDQVFGDLAAVRNDVDADPAFQALSTATPNAHKIAGRYATSDSFFSDGEASVQGHYWTTSATVDDYVEKSWRQYYSNRNHSSDSVGTNVSAPKNCSIFQAADAKATDPTSPYFKPGFTFIDDGDPVGAFNPSIAPGSVPDLTPSGNGVVSAEQTACGALLPANVDLTNFGNFLGLDDRRSAQKFLTQAGLTPDGDALPGSTGTLRNFTYLELPLDHTTGFTPQGPSNIDGHTPRAQIAENDAAVGMVVSALSKSQYWPSTAVFVVEDDSQDGPDHVDGHRNVLLVASPYARQTSANGCYGGYVGHVHNDQAGVLRTIELILGLPALSSYDQNAAPLYDLFQPKSTPAQLTAADLAPYDPAPDPSFVDEKVGDPSAGTAAQQSALVQASKSLDLSAIDRAGPALEQVLAHSLHPDAAAPATASVSAEQETSATGAALAQSVRLAAQQTATTCTPTSSTGATPVSVLGAPPLSATPTATTATSGNAAPTSAVRVLARTGLGRPLVLLALVAVVLGAAGRRWSGRRA